MTTVSKVLRNKPVLAIEFTITSGEVNDLVYPSGDNAVSKAAADAANVVGILVVKPSTGKGTVETCYSQEMEVEFDGAVAAGDYVKIGANNTDGAQCFKKWVQATDNESLRIGLCTLGGADEATGTILV